MKSWVRWRNVRPRPLLHQVVLLCAFVVFQTAGISLLLAQAPAGIAANHADVEASAVETPTYPGRTLVFSPYVRSALVTALGSGNSGGELAAGVSLEPLFKPRMGARLGGGYRYASVDGDTGGGATTADTSSTVVAPFIGLGGQYHVSAGELVGIVPAAGLNLTVPILEYTPGVAAELFVETEVRLHLIERGFFTLHLGVAAPLRSPMPATVTLGFGLRRNTPIMVPFPEPSCGVKVEPERFSPDGDGARDTMQIFLTTAHSETVARWEVEIFDPQDNHFFRRSGAGAPPEQILWDGRSEEGELVSSASDYEIEYTVVDLVGRTVTARRGFLTDILVIEEDGRFKIRIPSITFPPVSADFTRLEDERVIERNRQVLAELAEIFGRFPEYDIEIEGHANMVYYFDPERARREQREELLPLSRARAQAVADQLVELGVTRERITAVGIGADRPLVPFSDAENRWKNRRVEFILVRPDFGSDR